MARQSRYKAESDKTDLDTIELEKADSNKSNRFGSESRVPATDRPRFGNLKLPVYGNFK
jgi:hypothetical protein